MLSVLLDSMRIGNYQDSLISRGPNYDPEGFEGLVWIALSPDRSIGLEMRAGQGDTYHAFAPVTWVDRKRARRATIYPKGRTYPGTADQIAFAVRGNYLLLVEEYSGEHPIIVEMRSGDILKSVITPSARAVWVPAPEGWPR
jgi:hypothetical protein